MPRSHEWMVSPPWRGRSGDEEAAGPQWDVIRAQALRLARSRLRDDSAAEEVAQEVLLRLWRTRARLADLDCLEAWVARVVHNEVLRHVERRDRRQGRETAVEGAGDHARTQEGPAGAVEDGIWLRQGVRRLPAVDRRIVLLHYYGDVPLPGVAAEIGMPLGSVKARVHRARKRLAQDLAA